MRTLTPTVSAEVKGQVVKYVLFVELDFSGGIVRVNTSPYDITWNTFNWVGVGTLGEVSAVQEKSDLTATKYSLGLSGVTTEIISIALTQEYMGRQASIWFGLVDESTGKLVILADPLLVFKGWMDMMVIQTGTQSKVTVTVETKLANWNVPRVSRLTDEHQQELYPGDRGMQYVALMEDYEIVWGRG